MPKTMRPGDVAFDLTTPESYTLHPHAVTKVDTGFEIISVDAEESRDDEFGWETTDSWPDGDFSKVHNETPAPSSIFLKIEGRGGLASKGIFPVGGVIDANFRGSVVVLLANITNEPYRLLRGDRCAQLIFYKCISDTHHNSVFIREAFGDTTTQQSTTRGKAGFGSSDNLKP